MKWLKNNKGKIIAVLIIAVILAFSYFNGNDTSEKGKEDVGALQKQSVSLSGTEKKEADSENDKVPVKNTTTTEKEPELIQVQEETVKTENAEERTTLEDVQTPGADMVCTLTVRCDTIIDNMDLLDESKKALIPLNGIIYENRSAVFNEGESVFDVLLREMKNSGIHFEYVDTPMYDSAYIEGINNIYEFDCGSLSGWLYRVNGLFPGCGSSQCKVNYKDVIEVVYTCNMGKDVGKN